MWVFFTRSNCHHNLWNSRTDFNRTMDAGATLERVDLATIIPVPTLRTICGSGVGMAVCSTLGLLVTSIDENSTLKVYKLPTSMSDAGVGLVLMCILGGDFTPAPMQFKFLSSTFVSTSGWMTFTGTAPSRHLLVTDDGHEAVHVIDVFRKVHMGYVAAPGTISHPRGVTAKGSLVAVGMWGAHTFAVRVFEGSGATWTVVRDVAASFQRVVGHARQFLYARGLRFTADGVGLVVTYPSDQRVSVFLLEDGSFVRDLATGLHRPVDVEEDCDGGWLVACSVTHTVQFVDDGGQVRATLGSFGLGDGEFYIPLALALVPGIGLVVKDAGRLQFFATPDVIAMASMSPARVAWMIAVTRGRGFFC
jgi:hypothetical protein